MDKTDVSDSVLLSFYSGPQRYHADKPFRVKVERSCPDYLVERVENAVARRCDAITNNLRKQLGILYAVQLTNVSLLLN